MTNPATSSSLSLGRTGIPCTARLSTSVSPASRLASASGESIAVANSRLGDGAFEAVGAVRKGDVAHAV